MLIVTVPDYPSPKNSKRCFHAIINVNYLIPRITWIAKNLKQSTKLWHYDNIESNIYFFSGNVSKNKCNQVFTDKD